MSGVGAAILAVAGRYLVPMDMPLSSAFKTVAAGFMGGCIFGMAIIQPRASLNGEILYLTGFLLWQTSVALCLLHRPQGETPPGE